MATLKELDDKLAKMKENIRRVKSSTKSHRVLNRKKSRASEKLIGSLEKGNALRAKMKGLKSSVAKKRERLKDLKYRDNVETAVSKGAKISVKDLRPGTKVGNVNKLDKKRGMIYNKAAKSKAESRGSYKDSSPAKKSFIRKEVAKAKIEQDKIDAVDLKKGKKRYFNFKKDKLKKNLKKLRKAK